MSLPNQIINNCLEEDALQYWNDYSKNVLLHSVYKCNLDTFTKLMSDKGIANIIKTKLDSFLFGVLNGKNELLVKSYFEGHLNDYFDQDERFEAEKVLISRLYIMIDNAESRKLILKYVPNIPFTTLKELCVVLAENMQIEGVEDVENY